MLILIIISPCGWGCGGTMKEIRAGWSDGGVHLRMRFFWYSRGDWAGCSSWPEDDRGTCGDDGSRRYVRTHRHPTPHPSLRICSFFMNWLLCRATRLLPERRLRGVCSHYRRPRRSYPGHLVLRRRRPIWYPTPHRLSNPLAIPD